MAMPTSRAGGGVGRASPPSKGLWPLLALVCLAPAQARILQPGDDWCAALNAAAPGEQILLAAGVHRSACKIRNRGTAEQPLVLASADTGSGRAQLAPASDKDNVIEVLGAAHLTIRDLDFLPTEPFIDAIRIKHGEDVTVEGCRFRGLGGHGVAVGNGDVSRVSVRGNRFRQRPTCVGLGASPVL